MNNWRNIKRSYIFSLHAIVMFLVIYHISRTNIMFANTFFSLHAIVMFLVIYRISRTNIMFANTLYCNC
jgi:hypothetical protein